MSSQIPPSPDVSIYNPSYFKNPTSLISSGGSAIDITYLDQNYVKYPFAQGTESFNGLNNYGLANLQDTAIIGTLTVNGVAVTGTATNETSITTIISPDAPIEILANKINVNQLMNIDFVFVFNAYPTPYFTTEFVSWKAVILSNTINSLFCISNNLNSIGDNVSSNYEFKNGASITLNMDANGELKLMFMSHGDGFNFYSICYHIY